MSGSGGLRIGTQGWNYAAWSGGFYPEGTRPAEFLGTYARAFDTVEVDSTFYAVPPSRTVRGWAERTPPGFVLALKMPQEVTHERRLRGVDEVAAEFFARARELDEKLGPVLVQLGPDFLPDELPALADFLPRVPRDLRVAVELRNHKWVDRRVLPGVLSLLAAYGVALALSDGPWIPRDILLALVSRPTADFHYVRWMGPDRHITDHSHVQADRSGEEREWAETLARMPERGIDVFGYFSNYWAGHAPASARAMQRLLGQTPVEPETLGEQTSLF
ncbi:MAG TPA: DUF72 domain-containing protein [Longimicrobiaceae bacterium]|nr:DUF72 domain-containing protein [Longimicrobiaceae bacterium]